MKAPRRPWEQSNSVALSALKAAAMSSTYVSLGSRRTTSPHEFYRYPARFTPEFVRAAVEAFTAPGDLVVDPFVGGGTTAVEAMTMGRRSLVADINALATFVTRVKTTPLDDAQISAVAAWVRRLSWVTRLDRPAPAATSWEVAGYFRHLENVRTWRLTKVIRLALASVPTVDPRVEAFCRCVVLRTAQWALDMREELPTVAEFRLALIADGNAMLDVAVAFVRQLPELWYPPVVADEPVPGLSTHDALVGSPVSLVITSPPYPGVYVNYHRWKLQGRLEIRAPYWITNEQDGSGLAYYTMGARADRTLNTYFDRLTAAFTDIAAMMTSDSILLQTAGFSRPSQQVGRYLAAMETAGLEETKLAELATEDDGRLWRSVPNRRWWTVARTKEHVAPHTSREVVLVHHLRS